MNKRPLVLRTIITLVVLLVFGMATHPLFQRDYYDTFLGMLKDKKDVQAQQLVEDARELQKQDSQLYQSQALLQAADAKGIDLTKKIAGSDLKDNRDVMSLIRKNASSSIRLGLDLNGGVEFVLQLVPDITPVHEADAAKKQEQKDRQKQISDNFDHYRDIAIEILRKRLESQKIFEAEITPMGSDYVALRAPVVARDEKLKLLNIIKMSAKLTFRLVHENNQTLVQQYLANPAGFVPPVGYELMSTSEFRPGQAPQVTYFFVNRIPEMDGKGITSAMATRNEFGQRRIVLNFNQKGAEDFARVTGKNIHRQLAIVLDGKLYCAPSINGAITGGNAEISGSFSEEEAKGIANALESGSFPFVIKVDAVFDTDPKLGASNVANGIWVGVASLILMGAFLIAYYRLCGVIAVSALTLNVILLLGAMAAFGATLTLPGIAGIVLTIGMAVDANVLIFERIREELASGKSLMNAIDQGYSRAFSAVLDTNLTTLITSIILMSVGTGAIKGFAVTLSIGVLSSLFTALFVTRLEFDYLFRYNKLHKITMLQFFKKTDYNFLKLWKAMVSVSSVFILMLIVVVGVRGSSIMGVDFTGGTQVTFNYAEQIPQVDLEKTLKAAGYDATVSYKFNAAAASENKKLEILTRLDLTNDTTGMSPKDDLATLLNKAYPNAQLSGGLESTVGGLIGREFAKAAVWAVVLSIVGIGIYISLRYEFTFAMATVIALVHDVLLVLAFFLVTGRTISLSVVASLLTVIGYSINNTVVIFDRIRENNNLKVCKDFSDTINLSINQTLNRTVLTSLTTFMVVFALFVGGGIAINDFVFMMMLGILVGTYSSVYLSAPVVLWLQNRKNKIIPAEKRLN